MAFQIKDFTSIVASMINHMRGTTTKATDYQVGSVARTLVEAPAVEIEELYLQMFTGLREAIPVAVFQSFGFERLPPVYANGYVSISLPQPPASAFTVEAGAIFTSTDGRTYRSTSDVAWNTGVVIISVPVIATVAGAAGNIGAGLINSSNLGDEYNISNQPISNGADEEREEAREARFAEFIASLSRGTKIACMYIAKQATVRDINGNILERVTRIGYSQIAGYFKIFLYSSLGTPSQDLLDEAQMLLDGREDPDTGEVLVIGYSAAGVRGDILPMKERGVSMTISVRMRAGYTLTNSVRQEITDTYSLAIRSVAPGETLLIDNLRSILLGAQNVLEIALSTTQNIVCEQGEALVPGTVVITGL